MSIKPGTVVIGIEEEDGIPVLLHLWLPGTTTVRVTDPVFNDVDVWNFHDCPDYIAEAVLKCKRHIDNQ